MVVLIGLGLSLQVPVMGSGYSPSQGAGVQSLRIAWRCFSRRARNRFCIYTGNQTSKTQPLSIATLQYLTDNIRRTVCKSVVALQPGSSMQSCQEPLLWAVTNAGHKFTAQNKHAALALNTMI